MLKFHPLEVACIDRETDEAVTITFAVPDELSADYRYLQGQHLNLRFDLNGEEVRRSYSICSGVDEQRLQVTVKRVEGGRFSGFANEHLQPGATIDVMTPTGGFHTELDPAQAKTYVAFAAGSGITPVISNIRSVLAIEPDSRFILFYGNRDRRSVIFREALEDLKNRYMDRFSVHHVLSREHRDLEIYNGRLDATKVRALCGRLCPPQRVDEFLICGPSTMIDDVSQTLGELGVAREHIHFERFTTAGTSPAPRVRRESSRKGPGGAGGAAVTVIVDGGHTTFTMPFDGDSILDTALKHGKELPFSCKAGVCSTCRARLVEGEVDMAANFALEPRELEAGFILTCQSRPVSREVVVDFDHL